MQQSISVWLLGTAQLAMVSHGHGIEGKRAPHILKHKDEWNAHIGGGGGGRGRPWQQLWAADDRTGILRARTATGLTPAHHGLEIEGDRVPCVLTQGDGRHERWQVMGTP